MSTAKCCRKVSFRYFWARCPGIDKPAIHYSRTWRIRDEIIFSSHKILLAKTRWTCGCTLFVVHHQFSRGRRFFFDEKILCVCRWDRYPDAYPAYSIRQKTCSQNMANAFYTLFTVRRFFLVAIEKCIN